MMAKSSIILLEKLIDENNIFKHIKPSKKKTVSTKKHTPSKKQESLKEDDDISIDIEDQS